jgi:hypothetical protein
MLGALTQHEMGLTEEHLMENYIEHTFGLNKIKKFVN